MAEKLTPQQAQAVMNRGGKLLVSAAAGSGKTKVLVDRLMGYLTDPVDPANMDEFLIITYTKAAASELRGKIAAKLSEKIAENPENRHLQQQLQRLYMTQISTVHSFCADILRQYAYRLDLSADLSVADENECRQLREETLAQVLEQSYHRAAEDEDFRAFVDSQGIGRNDRQLPDVILKVYDSARCHLNPQQWLQGCLDAVDVEERDAAKTRWGGFLMERLFERLDLHIEAMERCAALASNLENAEKPAALLAETVTQLRYLRQSATWDEVVARKNIDFGTLRFSKKCPDMELQEGIKAVRNACKEDVQRLSKSFVDTSERALDDLVGTAPAVRGMVALVRAFEKAYDRVKLRRHIMDFGDLEHRTLDLLLGKNRNAPTAAAREIGARFREVMVDEYQDSNQVQDAIYAALTSQRGNCFMVGDVKQSIYQFRLADPGIFLEKYSQYVPTEASQPGQGRKVLLSRNFRSGGAVLEAVNCVFETCMTPAVGGLHYGYDEALHEGIPHEPLGEPEVELYGIEVRESSYHEEAAFTARRIQQLLDGTHMIRGKSGLRPITPGDIVILLRAPGSVGQYFCRALEGIGIRCTSGGGTDLLRTPHIEVLRSLLQAIHNPQIDIPLVAALVSPVFGFTADDLAAIRSGSRGGSVYDALRRSDLPKAVAFMEQFSVLRHRARLMGVAQLLEEIFSATAMDGLYGAMEDGETAREELMTFYQFAVDYESAGQKDLGQFLEHLQAMEVKGLVTAEDAAGSDSVTIMSIHKSKGLEFPVVFLGGLARHFNPKSQQAQVLCHKELGIGISAADNERRVRYPTIAKRAISAMIGSDSVSEELRVLYVAMTRAKDRLIMTYPSNNLGEELREMSARLRMGQQELLTRQVICPGEWVLMAALGRIEAGALFDLGGSAGEGKLYEHPWLIQVVEAPELMDGTLVQEKMTLAREILAQMKENLQFRYPYPAATVAPSKQTATQRKGREKDREAEENAQPPKPIHRYWRKASFADSSVQGRERGVALHKAMQYIRYEACVDEAGVRREVERMVAERFLTAEQGELVDCEKIGRFFATDIGKRLRSGKNVLREFKFSILDDGECFDKSLAGEKLLLQGVVDCALMDADGICVVDFKTDRVTETSIHQAAEEYRPQVEAYAQALSRIFEMPVKRSCLYFFSLEQFVEF